MIMIVESAGVTVNANGNAQYLHSIDPRCFSMHRKRYNVIDCLPPSKQNQSSSLRAGDSSGLDRRGNRRSRLDSFASVGNPVTGHRSFNGRLRGGFQQGFYAFRRRKVQVAR